jgi:hypothetical protein
MNKLEKTKASDTALASTRSFHMTIGTKNDSIQNIDSEIHLLRTALLYGDKVKICSIPFSHLYRMNRYATTKEGALEALESSTLLPKDETERAKLQETISNYRAISRKKSKDIEDLRFLSRFNSLLPAYQASLIDSNPPLKSVRDFKAIQKAVDDNILEIHEYDSISVESILDDYHKGNTEVGENGLSVQSAKLAEEFIKVLSDTDKNKRTYPLYDNKAFEFINTFLKEKKIELSQPRIALVSHCATVENLFNRLPDFGIAPLDVILDIRKDLRKYLTPFRAGINKYSAEIKVTPWDKDFGLKADELFLSEVKPAFEELEDSIKSNRSILKEIKDAKTWLLAGLTGHQVFSWFVADYGALPLITKIAFGLSIPAIATLLDWLMKILREPTSENKSHTLYFYYRLRDRLEQ